MRGRASAGFKAGPATWRIVVARWVLYVLAMIPGIFAMIGDLNQSVGRRPFFNDLEKPLDILGLRLLLAEIGGPGLGLLAAGAALIWILQQGWLAGATRLLDPDRASRLPVRWELFEEGPRYLMRFLRIALLAAGIALVGWIGLRVVFDSLADRAEIQGWSVERSFIDLNLWHLALLAFGLTLVGTFAFWAKVITAADDRRYTRRIPWLVLRLFAKRPVASLFFHFGFVVLVLFLQASALWSWRQSPQGLSLWLPLWLVLLFLASYVWQARVRAALLVWRGTDLALLRATPDSPWYLFSRGFRAVFRRVPKPSQVDRR